MLYSKDKYVKSNSFFKDKLDKKSDRDLVNGVNKVIDMVSRMIEQPNIDEELKNYTKKMLDELEDSKNYFIKVVSEENSGKRKPFRKK